VAWFGLKSARKRQKKRWLTEKREKGKQSNALQRPQGDEETTFHFRYSQEHTTRNLKRTLTYKRRAHIAGSFTIIQVGPSDPITLDTILALPPVIHRRRPSHSFSSLSLLLIRTSAGCVSYAVGRRGLAKAEDEWWGYLVSKDDLGFLQHGPRHVTDPTKDQWISSSSRGNNHVVLNTRTSGAQMSHCASSIRYFNGKDVGSVIVLSVGDRTL
jgi:hypothetical protein